MKNLFVGALLLFAVSAKAQMFEGTMTWSIKSEITDPKMKARMEEGQKKMADPANQAKMKEAMEKMNDPKMKAMMDANPQIKAQMENMMKMAQGGSTGSMMPSSMTFKAKGGNYISMMQGGMFDMEILHRTAENRSVMLHRNDKTYTVMPQGNSEAAKNEMKSEITVTKTTETAKILNYTCTKYIVAIKMHDRVMNNIYWTTKELNFDMAALYKQRMNRGQQMFYEGVDGVPLKMEMTTPQGNMIFEVTDINRKSLPDSDFVIPSDFKEVQGMIGR